MNEQRDVSAQGQTPPADDAADVARVAELVGRAGLRLTTAEIAQLVAEYRYDRASFDRMRTMLLAEDETAHAFRAERVTRSDGERSRVDEDSEARDASPRPADD
jgi:hypothetical protein